MARRRSKRSENSGQYAPLDYPLLRSRAWRSLSGPAVKVFLELHTRFHGANNGELHLSMNEAAEVLGLGKATVQRAFAELERKGLIALTRPGNWYSRRAHEWRMTTKPTLTARGRVPPTQDWRLWMPEKAERGSEADPSRSRLVPRQNRERSDGSFLEPVGAEFAEAFGFEAER